MSDSTTPDPIDPRVIEGEYQAPAIDERTDIDDPLVAVVGSGPSAAFHPADEDTVKYEAPAIEERTEIDDPLVATTGSGPVCAVFRP